VLVTSVRGGDVPLRKDRGTGASTVGEQMRMEREIERSKRMRTVDGAVEGGGRGRRFVFEVIADRYEARVGRWCVFEVLEGGAGGQESGGEGGGRLKGVR